MQMERPIKGKNQGLGREGSQRVGGGQAVSIPEGTLENQPVASLGGGVGIPVTFRDRGVLRVLPALVGVVGHGTPALCPSKNTQSSVDLFERSASHGGTLKGPC